jgi:hypothetical protein
MGQFLGPETDRMCQLLGPETDIMGERYYILYYHISHSISPDIAEDSSEQTETPAITINRGSTFLWR